MTSRPVINTRRSRSNPIPGPERYCNVTPLGDSDGLIVIRDFIGCTFIDSLVNKAIRPESFLLE